MIRFIKVWIMLLSLVSGTAVAFSNEPFVPSAADLLFQVEGDSEFSKAIADATTGQDSARFVHVAMVFKDDKGNDMIIEASPQEGVRVISLEEFLSDSPRINGKPGVVVKRISFPFPAKQAVERALDHLGEPYDWWYLPDNGKMYCSELVYEVYLDDKGHHIFSTKPMNFRAPDGSMPEFWIKLFEELGMPVPEETPGTNPNDLAKDPSLIEVFRYY